MRCAALLVVVAFSACPPAPTQTCAPLQPFDAGPPPTCPGAPPACGLVSTDAGMKDCGECPWGLVCGAVAPGLCGGLVCTAGGATEQVLHLSMSLDDAGVFVSAAEPFGRLRFRAPFDDADVGVEVAGSGGRSLFVNSRSLTTTNDVVQVSFTSSESFGSGGNVVTTHCEGRVTYTLARPWAP